MSRVALLPDKLATNTVFYRIFFVFDEASIVFCDVSLRVSKQIHVFYVFYFMEKDEEYTVNTLEISSKYGERRIYAYIRVYTRKYAYIHVNILIYADMRVYVHLFSRIH